MTAVYSEMSHRSIFLNKEGVVEQCCFYLLYSQCRSCSDTRWALLCFYPLYLKGTECRMLLTAKLEDVSVILSSQAVIRAF